MRLLAAALVLAAALKTAGADSSGAGRHAPRQLAAVSENPATLASPVDSQDGDDLDDPVDKGLHAEKLISIDDEGKLVLNQTLADLVKNAGVESANNHQPVNVITMFGRFSSGKSTLSTMLACKMAHVHIHFPVHKERGADRTYGVWISHPFKYKGRHFIIMDMEGLRHVAQSKERENAIVKIIAMLSEISSIFLQTLKSRDATDLETIGHAFRDTREHLITSGGGSKTEVPGVRAQNHASLFLVERVPVEETADDSNGYGKEDKDAEHLWEALKDDDYKKILATNFQGSGRKVVVAKEEYRLPWSVVHLPELRQRVDSHGNPSAGYDWVHVRPFEHGEGCGYLKEMEGSDWEDTPVAKYAKRIDALATDIAKYAVERKVAWGNAKGVSMGGSILWDALETGVNEMNNVGPLPDDEMWRLIMSGGCEKRCVERIDKKLGYAEGTLRDIDALVNARPKAGGVVDRIEDMWDKNFAEVREEVDQLLRDSFSAVRDACKEHTDKHLKMLGMDKEKLVVKAKLFVAETQLRHVQGELRNKKWEEDRLFITGVVIGGAIISLVLMRMFRQVNMTCRECLGCFGDCFTTKSQKQLHAARNSDGGVELHAITEHQHGAFAPSPSDTAASSKDATERIARLERMIIALQDENLVARRSASQV